MFAKQSYAAFIMTGIFFAVQPVHAESNLGQIVSFDDEEVEVRFNGEIDYWPTNRLGKPPITILEKDSSNFVRIKTADKAAVWVSLSYVTTNHQTALKKNCQSQKLAQSENKKQFGIRGIGESCE
ncbi:MAG: hypothetical protein ACC650_03500 [Gammaproteobacteria bacterium]